MIQQNQSPVNCKLLPLIGCPDSAPDIKEKADPQIHDMLSLQYHSKKVMPPKSITLCLMNSISWISYMVLAISALLPYENVDVIPVPLFFRDLLALLSYIFRLQPVGCFTSQLIYTSTSQGLKDFLGKLVWLPWFQRQQQSSTLQLSGYHEDQTICRWPGFNSLPFHYVAKKKKKS